MKFHSVPDKNGHALVVGPWYLGTKVTSKPSDKRPNLYLVFPGTEHRTTNHPDYNHNEVLSAVPDAPSNFDVWWVVVLDPTVKEDFTSEQQIIMATQETFTLPEDFTFEQIPSAGFLAASSKSRTWKGWRSIGVRMASCRGLLLLGPVLR